jgi:ribosomal-protein-alanine N-acetyltransferase
MAGNVEAPVALNIRPMCQADLDDVVANETSAYQFPWGRGVFADCLKAGNQCWVAEVDALIVGHTVVTIGAGEAHLLNVCIGRELQGAGYGRTLVLHALELARNLGADALVLEVRPSNQVAARLYESLGFNEIGVRKNYYPGLLGQEDARVLVIDLESFFDT